MLGEVAVAGQLILAIIIDNIKENIYETLPRDVVGMRKLESSLTVSNLARLRGSASDANLIKVNLPRVKVGSNVDVVKVLQNIHVSEVFWHFANRGAASRCSISQDIHLICVL